MKMDVVRILVSVAILGLSCDAAFEPSQCKYSFQENLLEKLVRMEFRMENMEKEIVELDKDKANSDLEVKMLKDTVSVMNADFIEANDTIEKLETMVSELSTENEELKKKMLYVANRLDVEKLETMVSELSAENQELMKDLLSVANRLDVDQSGPVIGFHARLVADITPKPNVPFVFQTVMLNEGNVYDKSTGYFTAPFDGIYHFTAHLCVYRDTYLHYAIMVESERWASGLHINNDYTGTCGAVSVTTKVLKGQRVWVIQDSSSQSQLLYEDNNDWNQFSGFLVKKL